MRGHAAGLEMQTNHGIQPGSAQENVHSHPWSEYPSAPWQPTPFLAPKDSAFSAGSNTLPLGLYVPSSPFSTRQVPAALQLGASPPWYCPPQILKLEGTFEGILIL